MFLLLCHSIHIDTACCLFIWVISTASPHTLISPSHTVNHGMTCITAYHIFIVAQAQQVRMQPLFNEMQDHMYPYNAPAILRLWSENRWREWFSYSEQTTNNSLRIDGEHSFLRVNRLRTMYKLSTASCPRMESHHITYVK